MERQISHLHLTTIAILNRAGNRIGMASFDRDVCVSYNLGGTPYTESTTTRHALSHIVSCFGEGNLHSDTVEQLYMTAKAAGLNYV